MTPGLVGRVEAALSLSGPLADSREPGRPWVPGIPVHVVTGLLQVVFPVEFLYILEALPFFMNSARVHLASKLRTLVSCMLSSALSTSQLPILSKHLDSLHYANVSLTFLVSEKLMSLCHFLTFWDSLISGGDHKQSFG